MLYIRWKNDFHYRELKKKMIQNFTAPEMNMISTSKKRRKIKKSFLPPDRETASIIRNRSKKWKKCFQVEKKVVSTIKNREKMRETIIDLIEKRFPQSWKMKNNWQLFLHIAFLENNRYLQLTTSRHKEWRLVEKRQQLSNTREYATLRHLYDMSACKASNTWRNLKSAYMIPRVMKPESGKETTLQTVKKLM